MHSGANQLKIACRPTLMFCKACPNGGAEVQVYPRKRGHGGYGGRASENGLTVPRNQCHIQRAASAHDNACPIICTPENAMHAENSTNARFRACTA